MALENNGALAVNGGRTWFWAKQMTTIDRRRRRRLNAVASTERGRDNRQPSAPTVTIGAQFQLATLGATIARLSTSSCAAVCGAPMLVLARKRTIENCFVSSLARLDSFEQ